MTLTLIFTKFQTNCIADFLVFWYGLDLHETGKYCDWETETWFAVIITMIFRRDYPDVKTSLCNLDF